MGETNPRPVLIAGGGIAAALPRRSAWRNAIMRAKSSEDYYRDPAWLYGRTALGE